MNEQQIWPFISVVMPIRNEAGFIEDNLRVVLNQDYPADRLEVLVADGVSDDGTRDIIARFAKDDSRVTLIDNPERIVSTGLNRAIRASRGEIVVRIDGHIAVAPDFLRQNVLLLEEHPDAWCSGGPILHEGKCGAFSQAVAAAHASRLGVGNARHHFADFEGYGEGTLCPAIRRWVFDRIGYFDEELVRNQDDEFTFRVAQAGGKFFISPRARFTYFVRDRVRSLFLQYFQYSFWRIPMLKKHGRPTTLRQLVPPLFYLTMFVLLVIGIVLRNPAVALALPVLYAAGLLVGGIAAARKSGWRVAALVPLALLTMHVGYALGYLYGLAAWFIRPRAWDRAGAMAKLTR